EDRAEAPLPSETEVTRLDSLGIAGILGYDPLGPFNDGTYDLVLAVRSDIAAKTWTVREDVTTGYVMLDLDTQVGSLPLVGNVGVQIVHTDQGSTAFSSQGIADTLVLVETEGGKSYTEVLPSLNLSLEVFDQTYVRLGMARTLSRARMDDLRASSEFSLSTDSVRLNSTDLSLSPWSAGGGNPELDPWLADSFDLSFEQYFGNGLGYWSIAAFYKDLKSYIVSDQVLMDFSGFPTNGLEPQLDQGYRTVPINGEGGKV